MVLLNVNNMILYPGGYITVAVNNSEIVNIENDTLLFVNSLEFFRAYLKVLQSELHSLDSNLSYNFH